MTEEYSIGYEDGKSAGFDECMAQQRTAEQSSRTLAWVGLTDEEVEEEWVKMCGQQRWAMHAVYAREIEAKLKAKNERLEKNNESR